MEPTTKKKRPGPSFVPLDQRVLRMSTRDPDSGCLVWNGPPTNAGYGQMTVYRDGRPRTQLAHRVSYETFVGSIPEGMQLDHLCRVRLCVNPAHLEPVTPRENLMRSPIAQAAINAAKTHCPKGHPYDASNTREWRHHGRVDRICKSCKRAYDAARYAARKAVSA